MGDIIENLGSNKLITTLLGIENIDSLKNAWGNQPIINSNEDLNIKDIFSSVNLHNIFSTKELPGREVRILNYSHGEQKPEPILDDVISIDYISQAIDSGFSVMIRRINQYSKLCASIRRRLSMELGCKLSDNLFISPPGCAALSQHADEHHTLNVQISGSKIWKLFSPPSDGSRIFGPTNSKEEIICSAVKSGSALYVPSRFPHEVYAVGEVTSISIAYAVNPICISEIINKLVSIGEGKKLWIAEDFEVISTIEMDSSDIIAKLEYLLDRIRNSSEFIKDDLKSSIVSDVALSLI